MKYVSGFPSEGLQLRFICKESIFPDKFPHLKKDFLRKPLRSFFAPLLSVEKGSPLTFVAYKII